jgi:hypothetical protein
MDGGSEGECEIEGFGLTPHIKANFFELAITGYSTWLAATSALAGLAKRLNRSAQALRKIGIHAPKPIE